MNAGTILLVTSISEASRIRYRLITQGAAILTDWDIQRAYVIEHNGSATEFKQSDINTYVTEPDRDVLVVETEVFIRIRCDRYYNAAACWEAGARAKLRRVSPYPVDRADPICPTPKWNLLLGNR